MSAPEPPRAAAAMTTSWLAAQGRLPLAFMGLGLAWLVAATALLAARPGLLALPHSQPHVVALVHAWVLGVFLTVACGAVYQLAPVALGTTLASEPRAWGHLLAHAAGVPVMVWAFWHWDLDLLGAGGLLVAAGALLFVDNTWRTVRRSGQRNAVAWGIALAAGWLAVTVLAGLVLAANRAWDFIPADPLALLRMHAHLGLIGFFLTLLQGVAFKLVPMFTLGEVRDWRPANTGLWFSQGGLLGLAPCLALGANPEAAAFALLVVFGVAWSGWGVWRTLGTRKKRALDPGLRAFLLGLVGLGVASLAGLLLVWPYSPWGSAPGGLGATTYGVLILIGGLLPVIAGMMCKIVPFLTWLRAYGPKVGRGFTPPAASLTHPRLERAGLWLLTAALAPLLVGAWRLSGPWLDAGAWLLATGVALFVADMLGVLAHLRWPRTAPLAPGGKS